MDDPLKPGGKPLPKWFLPAAVVTVIVAVYYAYKKQQAAGTSTASTTAADTSTGSSSVPVELTDASASTGTDQQALINQLSSGLSGLFGPSGSFTTSQAAGFAGTGTAITTLAQAQAAGFSSVAQAQAAQTTQLQQNLASVQAAILQAQQTGDTATASALAAQSTALQQALAAQNTGITGAFSSLWQQLQAAFGGVTTGLTQSQTLSTQQNAAVISQIQQTTTALSNLFGGVEDNQYLTLGQNSAAACFAGAGNISQTCLESRYPIDRVVPAKAGDDADVEAKLKTQYASCWNATSQTFDLSCVGKMLAGGQLPGH